MARWAKKKCSSIAHLCIHLITEILNNARTQLKTKRCLWSIVTVLPLWQWSLAYKDDDDDADCYIGILKIKKKDVVYDDEDNVLI